MPGAEHCSSALLAFSERSRPVAEAAGPEYGNMHTAPGAGAGGAVVWAWGPQSREGTAPEPLHLRPGGVTESTSLLMSPSAPGFSDVTHGRYRTSEHLPGQGKKQATCPPQEQPRSVERTCRSPRSRGGTQGMPPSGCVISGRILTLSPPQAVKPGG